MKVRLRDIRLSHLDTETRHEVLKFARTAQQVENKRIDVDAEDLIREVFNYGLVTENLDLRMSFLALRRSLKRLFAQPGASVAGVEMINEQGQPMAEILH